MQIIGLLLGVVGAIWVWYWRFQMAKNALNTAVDAAGRVKGAYNRRQFRNKTAASILAGIDQPGDAAAVLLAAIMQVKPTSAADIAIVDKWLEETAGLSRQEREDAMAFGRWAVSEIADPNDIVRRFLPLWRDTLDAPACSALTDMSQTAARFGDYEDPVQTSMVRLLRDGLGH